MPNLAQRGLSRESVLHIFILFSFAVSQPLFDILAKYPEYFVAHQTTMGDLLILVLLFSALPPMAAVAMEWLAWRVNESVGRFSHLAGICLLVTAIVNPVAKTLPNSWNGLRILLAFVIGLFVAWVYDRFRHLRTLLTLLAPGILLFPAVFLLNERMQDAVSKDQPAETELVTNIRAVEVGSDVPIVMIILDELPITSLMNQHREIDAERFPAFGLLARSSTWYRNATTVADGTTFALPAVLTGRYPDRDKIPIYGHYPENLLAFLADDYRLSVHEAATEMTPSLSKTRKLSKPSDSQRRQQLISDAVIVYLHVVLPLKVTRWLPDISNNWEGFGRTTHFMHQRFLKALGSDRVDPWRETVGVAEVLGSKELILLHSLLPHSPFYFLPTGSSLDENSSIPNGGKGVWQDEELLKISFYRHLLQLGYVDRLLGEVLAGLERAGVYDDCMLVLMADHGISFRLGEPYRSLTPGNRADIMSVPLFIKLPGQSAGRIDDRDVELIDVFPTVADVLNIEGLAPMDGQSLLGTSFQERKEKRILKSDGQSWLTFPVDREDKYETLERQTKWFGMGADADGMFYPQVHGKALDALVASIREEVGAGDSRTAAAGFPGSTDGGTFSSGGNFPAAH